MRARSHALVSLIRIAVGVAILQLVQRAKALPSRPPGAPGQLLGERHAQLLPTEPDGRKHDCQPCSTIHKTSSRGRRPRPSPEALAPWAAAAPLFPSGVSSLIRALLLFADTRGRPRLPACAPSRRFFPEALPTSSSPAFLFRSAATIPGDGVALDFAEGFCCINARVAFYIHHSLRLSMKEYRKPAPGVRGHRVKLGLGIGRRLGPQRRCCSDESLGRESFPRLLDQEPQLIHRAPVLGRLVRLLAVLLLLAGVSILPDALRHFLQDVSLQATSLSRKMLSCSGFCAVVAE
eukprot:scaffold148_cov243-Pinguiococcus_pyrenoidosus.AAC.2